MKKIEIVFAVDINGEPILLETKDEAMKYLAGKWGSGLGDIVGVDNKGFPDKPGLYRGAIKEHSVSWSDGKKKGLKYNLSNYSAMKDNGVKKKNKCRKIIAVDFDGTIVKNKFPKIGKINRAVVAKMEEEKQRNNTVFVIWTCRRMDRKDGKEMKEFLIANRIPFDYVNQNVPWLDFRTSRKIYADEYWDDRGINVKE